MNGALRLPPWVEETRRQEPRRLTFQEAERLGVRPPPWVSEEESVGSGARVLPRAQVPVPASSEGPAAVLEQEACSGPSVEQEPPREQDVPNRGGASERGGEESDGREGTEARSADGSPGATPPGTEPPERVTARGEEETQEQAARSEPRPFRRTGRLEAMGHGGATEPPPPLRTPPPGSASVLPPPPEVSGPSEDSLGAELAEALQQRIEAFAEAALELAAARNRVLAQAEGELLALAVEVARAIVEEELRSDPQLHLTLARSALQAIGEAEQVVLRASPSAYDAILEAQGGAFLVVHGTRVEVQVDPTLQGLGCVVETGEARVDGRVEERLRAVRMAFEEEHRRHRAAEEEGL